MARTKRPAPRPRPAPSAGNGSGGGPRRLGGANNSRQQPSQSAQRRIARKRQQTRTRGWAAVVFVVIAVLVVVLVKVVGGSGSGGNTASGRNPPLANAEVVHVLATIPASVFNDTGTSVLSQPFSTPKNAPLYGTASKPKLIYYGAEFCPYCAVMRWAIVIALSRFGSFHGLKQIESSSTDSAAINVPTFSFHGATYTSKYLTFSPTEYADRLGNNFETPPAQDLKAVETYAFPPYTPQADEAGIPFIDVGGKYYSVGVSSYMQAQAITLQNGGPGRLAIAKAMADPSSSVGKGIYAPITIAQANYLSAAICATNGDQPASVCTSKGVMIAAKALKKASVVS